MPGKNDKFYLLLIVLAVFLTPLIGGATLAATTPADTMAAALQSKLAHIKTFSADFRQTVYDAQGRVLQQTSGQFIITRPDRFRWQTTMPDRHVIVSDGQTVWDYDADLQQVIIRSAARQLQNSPVLLPVLGGAGLSQSFNVTHEKDGDYLLTPKKNNNNFRSIRLRLLQNVPEQMSLETQIGQRSTIMFSNVQINEPLPHDIFKFVVPRGHDTDVVDERKKISSAAIK